jgi:hypothetical protein
MPKKVETLSQVRECLTRELKSRTQARCAELLVEGHQQRAGRHTTPEPVSICLCRLCQQGKHANKLRTRTRTKTAQRETVYDHNTTNVIIEDDEGYNIEDDTNVVAHCKDWTTCINVSCFLLSLVVVNCLFLQYMWLYKAERL